MKTHGLTTKIRAKKPKNICNCERWVNDLVQNSSDVGVVCGAATDYEAFEDARVVRGCEKARRSAHVGSHDVRLFKPK